ncbi:FG-GAP repeat protein [Streptomyces sp. NPDC098101]|uniref:FG-GAP repeat protein n=1 Tax=Streptomyces sp. NPDC098101 TaxID=3366096 RepID=UPI0037FF2E60
MAVSAAALAIALSAGPEPLGNAAVAAPGCSGAGSDFNGDGFRDTAVADPQATVNGIAKAGVVHIVYGGGAGTLELTQEAAKAGPSEADDAFGHALAVYDADLDGCADLAIGTPYEDVGTQVDSGRVVVVYGAPAGLGAGRTTTEYVQQTAPLAAIAAEAYDWFGYSVTAGKTAGGVPFMAAGMPGEDIGTGIDAGAFVYFSGSTTVTAGVVNQDVSTTAGAVPDAVESYDRFGEVLVATPHYLAASSPGEAQGTLEEAGAVTIFNHALTSNVPKPLNAITQDSPNVNGGCEFDDGFGTALAAVTPFTSAAVGPKLLLAVGIPGEDLTADVGLSTEYLAVDGGAVQVFSIDSAGAYTEENWIDQDSADVEDKVEAGDYFGRSIVAHTEPGPNLIHLAVGVPGQDVDGVVDRGAVQIFTAYSAPGTSDRLLEPGVEIPAPAGPRLYTGLNIGDGANGLYVGLPYGPPEGHAVHVYAWPASRGATTWRDTPSSTFRPGEGGLPAEHKTFGTVVR